MKSLKGILAALAFVFAIGAAFATSTLSPSQGYIKIGSGNFPSQCQVSESCDGDARVCTNQAGVQLFGLDGTATRCDVILMEN